MRKYLTKLSKLKLANIVEIAFIAFLLIGASYAYFQAQTDKGTSVPTSVKTGTVDNLTFSLRDIDVTDDTKTDEHNSDGVNDYSDIVITATEDNFGPNAKSLGDGVELSAHLLANDKTNEAEAQYNLFFVIDENNFTYTTEEERPEIILEVIDPLGKPVDNIVGLKKVEGGYDITKRKNATFLITPDYVIKANPKEEQKWQVKVTLVNFKDVNQKDNAGKSLSGKIYITTKDMPSYELPSVSNSEIAKTYNTITFTPTVVKGTENIVKYYYGIEKKQTNGVSLMSEDTVKFEESDKPSYTFEKLQANTEYTIYSYVEDESGMRSNTYHTDVTTNVYKEPKINGVTFERGLYSIKATVDAIGRDGEITTYHYYKDDELVTSIASKEYTYEGLSDTSSYKLKIEVEDSNHVKSTAYEETVSTLEYIYPEVESVDVSDNKWNSVTLTTNTKKSTNDVTEYKYQVEKKDGTVVQAWFVGSKTQVINNLDANQEYNVKIKLKDSNNRESKTEYIQEISTEEYNYVQIKVTPTITTDSIKLDVSATIGDGTITKYMYSKNGGDSWEEFSSTDLTHSYTFGSLTSDTEFPIWVKVIDSNNKESNIYKETLTTKYIEPTAQDVVLTKIDGANITATLNVTQGSRPFATYYFKVNDATSFTSSSSNTYNFNVPETGNIKVEAYAVDSKNHETKHVSTTYTNPSISKIEVEEVNGTSIKVKVTGAKGTSNIKGYYISIDKGESYQEVLTSSLEAEYTYEDINNKEAFNVQVYVKDEKNRKSNEVIKGIKQVTINFNGNGNSISSNKESCFIIEGQESCKITTPTINKNANTPTIVGYSLTTTDHSKVIGSNEELTVRSEDNGKTYYAQTTKEAIKYAVNFNANGNEIDAESKECTIGATYNGVEQGTSCNVETPTITPNGNTPIVIGYNLDKDTHESQVGSKATLGVNITNNGKTYYAQSKNNPITHNISYTKQGKGVTAIGKESDKCTRESTYNGVKQAESCNVVAPSITVLTGYTAVGWNLLATAETGTAVNNNITLTGDAKYYAISYKNEVTYNVTYDKNNNTIAATSGSCTIPKAYNENTQATSCTTTTPKITANPNTPNVIGYNQNKEATTAEVGSEASLTLSATNNGKTYYAISSKEAVTYSVTYDKNNNTIAATSGSCTIGAVYNGAIQATSCTTTTPKITAPDATPKVLGYNQNKEAKTAEVGSEANLTLNATNNGKTYYAITTKEAVTYKVNYDGNGNTVASETGSCGIAATFNGVAQGTSCNVTTPKITAPNATPKVLGYNQNKEATTAEVGSEASLTLNATNNGKTYYAITTNSAIVRKITFNKNNNTSFTYGGQKYTDASKQFDLCTIGATYNGTKQGTSCEATITMPIIEASGNTPTVIGWNADAGTHVGTYTSGQTNVKLTATTDLTYYAQTTKSKVTYTVNFNANGNTVAATSKSCDLAATFNGIAQATSCDITTPKIIGHTNTPTVVGYNQVATTHSSQVGSEKTLAVTSSINGTTYYAQAKKDAVKVTITFNKNGASTQTNSGGTAVGDTTVTRECTKAETWNGVAQVGCNVKSPIIVGTEATPNVIGYSDSASNHSNGWSHNTDKTVTGDATWYAQTTKAAVTRKITFNKNNNASFTYGGQKYTDATKQFDLCTIGAAFNGATQGSSCEATITMPVIEAPSNTPTIIGWSTGATNYNKSYDSGQASVKLTATTDLTYYAQTTKSAVTRKIKFDPNGNTSFNYNKTDYTTATEFNLCTIAAIYNNNGGTAQATSCSATITMPTIKAHGNTPTLIGWNAASGTHVGTYTSGQANVSITTSGTVTYYAQTTKGKVTYTVNFNANGNTIAATSKSCDLVATFNGVAQATSCDITTPKITGHTNTPTVVGYNQVATTHSSQVGSEATLNVTSSINGKTYYAQAKKAAEKVTITFNKNGASTQTNSGGTAVSDTTVTRECTKAETWNGVAQVGCTVKSPTIAGTTITPTVIGYSDSANNHSNGWSHNTDKTVTGNATWYAQTTKAAVTKKIKFDPNGNTGFNYNKTDYTTATEFNLCTIAAIYNNNGGTAQATSCSATITMPTIKAHGNTPTLIGWNAASGTHVGTYTSGQANVSITSSGTVTYYAQTTKGAVTRTITYNKGTNVSATGKGSDSCTIGAVYNGATQGTTCNVTLTTITPASGYLVDGFYEGTTRKGNVGASITLSGNVTYTANVGTVSLVLNSASASQMKVTASVSPTSTPLAGSAYQYNTSNSWSGINATTSTTNTFSVNATSSYTLYVRVTDAQGNAVVKSVGYTNPSIGTPTTSNAKWNSLDVSVTATKGTADIASYYFSSNDGKSFGEAVANTTTTGTTTLTGLTPSTTYNIKAYVVDKNGRRSSNSDTGKGTTAAYTYPTVKITSTSSTTTSITINASATNGTGTVKAYRYYLGDTLKGTNTTSALTNSYTINSGIVAGNTYKVKVQVIDSNDKVSTYTTDNQKDVTVYKPVLDVLLADANEGTLLHHTSSLANSAADDSYRYGGASANVKNYVCLDGQSTESCASDDDLYRIIGLFKNTSGQYEMKLIKATPGTTKELGDANARADGDSTTPSAFKSGTDSYSWNSTKGKSGNDNMWKYSNLNKVNLNSFYYKYITKKVSGIDGIIVNHLWEVGGKSINLATTNANAMYNYELGFNKLTSSEQCCYNQGDLENPRLCNQDGDLTYETKIGLMYVSDYMYATIPSNWTTLLASSDSIGNNNWLYIGRYEWTITRKADTSYYNRGYAYYIMSSGGVLNEYMYGNYNIIVRPVFYLNSNVKIAKGNGSKTTPYRLAY